jgi:endonuclease III
MPSNKPYLNSRDLGIDLDSKNESQLFRWLLACLLYGKPIQGIIAKRAYEKITGNGITSLKKLVSTEWHTLVSILDEARYVRYDFSTAYKLLDVAKNLQQQYGSVSNMLKKSGSLKNLKQNLLEFKGVGPVTVDIFVREIGPIWYKKPTS